MGSLFRSLLWFLWLLRRHWAVILHKVLFKGLGGLYPLRVPARILPHTVRITFTSGSCRRWCCANRSCRCWRYTSRSCWCWHRLAGHGGSCCSWCCRWCCSWCCLRITTKAVQVLVHGLGLFAL